MVNDNYVYKVSKHTLRPSAVSRPALCTRHVASDAVAGLRFKSRGLKGLHLNAVKDKECNGINGTAGNNAENNEEKEEKKRAPLRRSVEKVCVQKHYGYQYEEGHQSLVHLHKEELQQYGQQHVSSRHKAPDAIISDSCSSTSRKVQHIFKDDVKHDTKCIPVETLLNVRSQEVCFIGI